MENRNKELELVNKLIKYARFDEDDKQTASLIVKDNYLYIKVKIVENVNLNEDEITILQNITEIVEMKIREWIMPSEDYIAKKFMKISSIYYDTNNKDLQERLEIGNNEDYYVDYIINETKFPCTILNYM